MLPTLSDRLEDFDSLSDITNVEGIVVLAAHILTDLS